MKNSLPEDGNDESGEEVRDADVRQTEEVRADAEDEDVADVAEIRECCGCYDGLDRAGHEEDRALKESDRDRREDAAAPEPQEPPSTITMTFVIIPMPGILRPSVSVH